MTPLCFLDCETTGVHPGREVWEVAMIRRDDTGQHELLMQVTDVDLSNADPFGLKVGGFYERHNSYNDSWSCTSTGDIIMNRRGAEVARAVEKWTRGAHLVGAVPDFDARTLDPLLRKHGFIPAWHYHLIDVEAMAVGWINGVNMQAYNEGRLAHHPDFTETAPPWKSDDLSRACGVEPPNETDRHTALGDARWAMRLYDQMTGGRL